MNSSRGLSAFFKKLWLAEKYIKYHDTCGRNVIVSWFGVTRTPEDAPKTPEDAPVVFCLTFQELPNATGITSIGACMQKLWLAEKYIKYQDTRGRNVNVSWFGVTRTPEDAPKTPEDAPVVFCLTFQELPDRKSTRLNSSHITRSRMPSSA